MSTPSLQKVAAMLSSKQLSIKEWIARTFARVKKTTPGIVQEMSFLQVSHNPHPQVTRTILEQTGPYAS